MTDDVYALIVATFEDVKRFMEAQQRFDQALSEEVERIGALVDALTTRAEVEAMIEDSVGRVLAEEGDGEVMLRSQVAELIADAEARLVRVIDSRTEHLA